jgi:hypothetical protein
MSRPNKKEAPMQARVAQILVIDDSTSAAELILLALSRAEPAPHVLWLSDAREAL